MIGRLRTRVHKQPITALYFESENEIKFYNLEAWNWDLYPHWMRRYGRLKTTSSQVR